MFCDCVGVGCCDVTEMAMVGWQLRFQVRLALVAAGEHAFEGWLAQQ